MPPDKSLPTQVTELWELVVAYFKQETIGPVKNLGRYVKYGVIGSVLLCIGLPILVLAVLRAVQAETDDHLTGKLTWIAYIAAAMLSGIIAMLAFWGMQRARRRKEAKA